MAFPDFPGDIDGYKNGVPNGLYYYWINNTDLSASGLTDAQLEETVLIPPIDVISSVFNAPYMKTSDFELREVEFDINRFKMGDITLQARNYNRIVRQNTDSVNKNSNSFKPYKPDLSKLGVNRDWRNEGKLYQFPFMYGVLNDNIIEPYEFKYHLCPLNSSKALISVPLSNFSTYSIAIENYKNDTGNLLEHQISKASNQIPLVSSGYAQYMAYNKAQLQAQKTSTLLNGIVAAGGIIAAPFTGGVSLAGTAAAGVNIFNNINGLQAKERDLKDQPNKIASSGSSDILYTLKRNTSNSLRHYRLMLKQEEMQKIGDFFAMFGYKQNKIMKPDLRSRHYYNYVKTIGINIQSNGIPKEHLNKLKNIFDNGVTIWHIDRNNVSVGDYSMDNIEV